MKKISLTKKECLVILQATNLMVVDQEQSPDYTLSSSVLEYTQPPLLFPQ